MATRAHAFRGTAAAQIAVLATLFSEAALPQVSGPLGAQLSADAVGPSPADPDGSGAATLRVDASAGELCYTISVEDIRPASAAHLHAGPAGRIGPIELRLEAPTDGSTSACVMADRDLLRALLQRPGDFYIDVHNAEYPGPALRGQLSSQ